MLVTNKGLGWDSFLRILKILVLTLPGCWGSLLRYPQVLECFFEKESEQFLFLVVTTASLVSCFLFLENSNFNMAVGLFAFVQANEM